MLCCKLGDNPASIGVTHKQFSLLKSSRHILCTDMWRALFEVAHLDRLQAFQRRLCDA